MGFCVPTDAGGKTKNLQHQFANNHWLWVRLPQKSGTGCLLSIFNFNL